MGIDRRAFLKSGAASVAIVGLGGAAGCASPHPHPGAAPRAEGESPFRHGVASGDPLTDRVILWTRVSPEPRHTLEAIRVEWWVARDAGGTDVVVRGRVDALPERDFTVKVDAAGLESGRDYVYGFECDGIPSPVGHTRTLPEDSVEQVRLAVTSCANYPQGFFNAYACIAQRDDVDVVLQLGDYLYEYANGQYGDGTALGRIPDPLHEIVSLEDYRRRHATYKSDLDLQAAHARHPWITVWDDHESANDSWKDGAQNHTEGDAVGDVDAKGRGEGAWSARRLAAIRAYHEWMPIRELPTGIFRTFRFGRLVNLVMLDTRLHGRDARVAPKDSAGAEDPDRTLLGADQTAWLLAQLSDSKRDGTRWRVIGQQVVFAPLFGDSDDFNVDSWDGYRANRREVIEHFEREGIDDVVILTGDVHSAWALDVPSSDGAGVEYDAESGRGSRAVELVTPAVSSPPIGTEPRARAIFEDSARKIPHVRYSNFLENGFIVVDLTRERARAEFYFSESVKQREAACSLREVFETRAGANHLVRVTSK